MKIPSPPRTEVTVDLRHKFNFDTSYRHVHKHSDCELKFFCETFSLIDAMRRSDLVCDFSQQIERTNGIIECKEILQLLRKYDLIEDSKTSASTDEGVHFLLDNIYIIVKAIIEDRFVSCMHTSTIGCHAWEIGELYKETLEQQDGEERPDEETNNNWKDNRKEKAHAWQTLSRNLHELAKYQHGHMKIYHDFQKSNYAPDPRTKTVYNTTFLGIFFGFFYLIFRNFNVPETQYFVAALDR